MKIIWQTLAKELGPGFITQYGEPEGEDFLYWEKSLSSFSENDFKRGLNKFKEQGGTFISLKLFRSLCKISHKDLGLPSMMETYQAVAFEHWHKLPESFRVLFSSHAYMLKGKSERDAIAYFKPVYENGIARIADGEEFKINYRPQIEFMADDHTKTKKRISKKHLIEKGNKEMQDIFRMIGKARDIGGDDECV